MASSACRKTIIPSYKGSILTNRRTRQHPSSNSLNKQTLTFSSQQELPFAIAQPLYLPTRTPHPNLVPGPVIKLNHILSIIRPNPRVHRQINLRFHIAVNSIPSSHHVKSRDCWMVAYLLADNRAAIQPALKGLTQDGIEGLLHL